jgi:hypothetical protein
LSARSLVDGIECCLGRRGWEDRALTQGVKREIRREDANGAKLGKEPAHNPLTIGFMPSLIPGTFQFTRKPSRFPESLR